MPSLSPNTTSSESNSLRYWPASKRVVCPDIHQTQCRYTAGSTRSKRMRGLSDHCCLSVCLRGTPARQRQQTSTSRSPQRRYSQDIRCSKTKHIEVLGSGLLKTIQYFLVATRLTRFSQATLSRGSLHIHLTSSSHCFLTFLVISPSTILIYAL